MDDDSIVARVRRLPPEEQQALIAEISPQHPSVNATLKQIRTDAEKEAFLLKVIDNDHNQYERPDRQTAYQHMHDRFLELYRKFGNSYQFKQRMVYIAQGDTERHIRKYNLQGLDEMQRSYNDDNIRNANLSTLDQWVDAHPLLILPKSALNMLAPNTIGLMHGAIVTRNGKYYAPLAVERKPDCDEYEHVLILRSLDDDERVVAVPHSLDKQNVRTHEVYTDDRDRECHAHGGHYTWALGCRKLGYGSEISRCKREIEEEWHGRYPRGHPKIGLCKELVAQGFLND